VVPIVAGLILVLVGADPGSAGIERVPSGVLVECEDFKLGGKWKLDNEKHEGFSGGGVITENASFRIAQFAPFADIAVPKSGRHNVWIRAHLGGPPNTGMHDRELIVRVNRERFRSTHRGLDGNHFVWELAGTVDIGADRAARIEIRDVGRSPAVADCVLLTDDLEFKPANWTGNCRRLSLAVSFEPPHAPPLEAKPYRGVKAPKEHVEQLTDSHHTYKVLVGGALDEFNTAYYPDTYGMCTREESKFQPNEYLALENVGRNDVVNPRIVVEGRRNWYSGDTILSGILKPGMTDAEKAIAIWKHAAGNDVQSHENNRRVGPYYPEDRSHPWRNTYKERGDPVRAANCYYCSGCQLSATNCVVLMRHAGLAARAVWMCPRNMYDNHCVAEVWYDGGWHLFDPERRSFYLESDNTTVASYETLHKNPGLVSRTHDGGFAVPSGKETHAKKYETFYPPPVMPVGRWATTMAMTLRPGERFVWRWDHINKFRVGQNPRNRNNPPYRLANGKWIYRPDLEHPGFRKGILSEDNVKATFQDHKSPAVHPEIAGDEAFISYRIKTPYPIVGGVVGGKFRRMSTQDCCAIYLSIGDSDWTEVWSADETGDFERCLSIDEMLGAKLGAARYTCYVKYEFSTQGAVTDVGLNGVYIELDVQMSGAALPSLSAGLNKVVYRDDTTGQRRVRITHGWKESSATRPPTPPAGPRAPADRATLTGESLRKFAWQPAADPDGETISDHHIQVSRRDDCLYPISPNFDRLTFSGAPEWNAPRDWFTPETTYYWRVRSRDHWGAWSPWSQIWKFRITRPSPAQ
jgi:hypothetical protein